MKKTLALAGVLLAVVGVASMRFNNQCVNLDALQGKSGGGGRFCNSEGHEQAVEGEEPQPCRIHGGEGYGQGRQDVQQKWEEHHLRKLDALTVVETKQAIDEYNQDEKNEIATNVECSFNVLEAFVSVVGMGDDINGIIRTCPPPRDGESELACQAGSGLFGGVDRFDSHLVQRGLHVLE